jgi:integrase
MATKQGRRHATLTTRKDRSGWWVNVHYFDEGRRRISRKRFPETTEGRRQAARYQKTADAQVALGTFRPERRQRAEARARAEAADAARRPMSALLDWWFESYKATFKPSTRESYKTALASLKAHFGDTDARNVGEDDLLRYAESLRDPETGVLPAPTTIRNRLAPLRRAFNVAIRKRWLTHNPARATGEIVRRLERQASEAPQRDAWSRAEIGALLAVAEQHEPDVAPLLHFLFATGCRKGEAIGLQWQDVDFNRGVLHVRRSVVRREASTPKNGRGRTLRMTAGLARRLKALRAHREREARNLFAEVPEWVFCNPEGSFWDGKALHLRWERVRRRAVREHGVRSLPLHCARHSWASHALEAGAPLLWVAAQLGHSDGGQLVLRTYGHLLRGGENVDLGFADFGPLAYPGHTQARQQHSSTSDFALQDVRGAGEG